MAFLINTSGVTTLTDLGNRILGSGLSGFDLGAEYTIEDLRYSADLAAAISAGTLEVTDDGKGRSIVGPVAIGVAQDFVSTIFHYDDDDVQGALGTLSINDLGDVNTAGFADGKALAFSSGNLVVSDLVSSVNGEVGIVTLDTDDITEGTNKYYSDTLARQAVSIEAGSSNYLSYNNTTGEFSISALAITDVTVDVTEASFAAWITANYTGAPGNWQEGDVLVGTTYKESYINNGGVAGNATDWTLLDQPNIDLTSFSATAPLVYDNAGGYSLDIKANGGLVIESNELAVDLGASSITGTLAIGDGGTGVTTTPTNGQLLIGNGTGYTVASITSSESTIDITAGAGTLDLDVVDNSLDEDKLLGLGTGTNGQVLTSDGALGFSWITSPTAKATWTWGAASKATNNNNRYLDRHDGVPTNEGPYIAWYASTLRRISLGTKVASTWTAEVHVNGASVATLASGGTLTATSGALSVAIAAGDKVSFYVNGSSVNTPVIDALFEEA